MYRALVLLFTVSLFFASTPFASGETAEQILQRIDQDLNNFKNMALTTRLKIVEKDGTEKVREMYVWQAGKKRLVKFLKPASEMGIALLSTDSTTNYVYLPAYRRVRRVAAHVRNQTFMGTDFSQEDMAITEYAADFKPSLVGEGEEYWTLELTRKPDAKISYSKILLKVAKDRFAIRELQYFDNKGEKLKVEERSDFHQDGKQWNPHAITMTSIKSNHQTFLENFDFKYDQNLKKDFFTERNLKRAVR